MKIPRNTDMLLGIYIHHILSSDNTKKDTPWLSNCNTPTRGVMSISAMTGGTGFLGTGEDGSEVRLTGENDTTML
jgi:hypothetical protein